jgi:hypothetical protein
MAGNRKISQAGAMALESFRVMHQANTAVERDHNDDWILKLHGNTIARITEDGLSVTTAGWNTPTTRERLNALDGVGVHQKNYVLYLNDKEWDGSWVKVSDFN